MSNTLFNSSTVKNNQQSTYKEGCLERIFHSAVARIIDFLIIFRDFDYSEADIARKTHLTYKTVDREIPMLLEEQIIIFTRVHGRSKMYKINENSDKLRNLIKFTDSSYGSNDY